MNARAVISTYERSAKKEARSFGIGIGDDCLCHRAAEDN
jgi:hypothetical protein